MDSEGASPAPTPAPVAGSEVASTPADLDAETLDTVPIAATTDDPVTAGLDPRTGSVPAEDSNNGKEQHEDDEDEDDGFVTALKEGSLAGMQRTRTNSISLLGGALAGLNKGDREADPDTPNDMSDFVVDDEMAAAGYTDDLSLSVKEDLVDVLAEAEPLLGTAMSTNAGVNEYPVSSTSTAVGVAGLTIGLVTPPLQSALTMGTIQGPADGHDAHGATASSVDHGAASKIGAALAGLRISPAMKPHPLETGSTQLADSEARTPLGHETFLEPSASHMDLGPSASHMDLPQTPFPMAAEADMVPMDHAETEAGSNQTARNASILEDLESSASGRPSGVSSAIAAPSISAEPMPPMDALPTAAATAAIAPPLPSTAIQGSAGAVPTQQPSATDASETPIGGSGLAYTDTDVLVGAPSKNANALEAPPSSGPGQPSLHAKPMSFFSSEDASVAAPAATGAVASLKTTVVNEPTIEAPDAASVLKEAVPRLSISVSGEAAMTAEEEIQVAKALWLADHRPSAPLRERGGSNAQQTETASAAVDGSSSAAAMPGGVATKSISLKRNELTSTLGTIAPAAVAVPSSIIEPTLFMPLPEVDAFSDALVRNFGSGTKVKRSVLNVADVDFSEDGLVRLMASNSWRAVVELAQALLTTPKAGELNLGRRFQIFCCRLESLMKLQQYEAATVELDALGDMDREMYFWSKQPVDLATTTRRGRPCVCQTACLRDAVATASYIPFALRLLHAELPHYTGDPALALKRLYGLLLIVRGVMESVAARHPDKLVYLSQMAHLHLQVGNTAVALQLIQRAEKRLTALKAQPGSPQPTLRADEERLKLDRGCLAMATGHFSDAVIRFEEAFAADPDNIQIINNLAVAHLYVGRLRQAIAVLEEAIRRNPLAGLHETVVFNLSTLYELESDSATENKKNVLLQAAKHYGDHFNVECLKNI